MAGSEVIAPVKDGESEWPIPHAWRDALTSIVRALAGGDYRLASLPDRFIKPTLQDAAHIQAAISDYGATITELPAESWDTSVCIWYDPEWDALVDLWSIEEGRSDLVLHAKIKEKGQGYTYEIHLVYVP
jgi:hypothetical protein